MHEVRLGFSETEQDEGISIPRWLSMWYMSPSMWKRTSSWGGRKKPGIEYQRLSR